MCSYSFIADHGARDLGGFQQYTWPNDSARIAELERRVKSLEDLLAKAKEYDAATGQPNCELDEKKQVLRQIAKQLGVEINLP